MYSNLPKDLLAETQPSLFDLQLFRWGYCISLVELVLYCLGGDSLKFCRERLHADMLSKREEYGKEEVTWSYLVNSYALAVA